MQHIEQVSFFGISIFFSVLFLSFFLAEFSFVSHFSLFLSLSPSKQKKNSRPESTRATRRARSRRRRSRKSPSRPSGTGRPRSRGSSRSSVSPFFGFFFSPLEVFLQGSKKLTKTFPHFSRFKKKKKKTLDRPAQHPVLRPGRGRLHHRGQPPRLPHRPLRRQGRRAPARRLRVAADVGHDPQGDRVREGARAATRGGQGGGAALREVRRGGHAAGPGDEVDRRGERETERERLGEGERERGRERERHSEVSSSNLN